jgi:hypothetical protein
MKTIDIFPYGRPHPMHSERYFVDAEHGKEVAEKTKLLEAVQAGPVDIVCNDNSQGYGFGSGCNNVAESFVRGFIGPTARTIGIDEFIRKVKVNGQPVDGLTWAGWFQRNVASYLKSEQKRLTRTAKEKARETNGVWSKPICLMVPGISTVMKLAKDWTFRLHKESRNNDMLGLFGKSSSWEDSGKVAGDVTMKAGAELSVNRVYIRQGADEFSSYTFYLKKGAELEMGGKKTVSRGKVRFWAKLADVNKMEVLIDTNTLAEN